MKLPKKWFIVRNKTNYKELNAYNDKFGKGNAYLSEPAIMYSDKNYTGTGADTKGYTEITFKQFQQRNNKTQNKMKQSEFKNGQFFSAELDGETIVGIVSVKKINQHKQDVFLVFSHENICGNTRKVIKNEYDFDEVFQLEFDEDGYVDEWSDITDIEIISAREFDEQRTKTVGEWNVRKSGTTFIFGCGEVELEKSDIKDFVAVASQIKNFEGWDGFMEVVNAMHGQDLSLDATLLKQAAALVK